MKKIIFLCFFCFSQTSFCQLVIQRVDSVIVESTDISIQTGQEALDINKNTFLNLTFPNTDYQTLNEVLDSLKSDGVSLISHPNGDTLSIPPVNYFELLDRCLIIIASTNEQILQYFGL
jgi:hypothetical protein